MENIKENPPCLFVKVVVKKHDGTELWIKKEGEKLNDYEVWDRIISLDYSYEDIYVVKL